MNDRRTLGLLVELPEVLPLLLVDDSEDSGNGLADSVATWIVSDSPETWNFLRQSPSILFTGRKASRRQTHSDTHHPT